jgi:hypothetical protein
MGTEITFNWAAVAAVCSLLGVFATLIGVAFTSGRLTEKLGEASKRIDGHDETLRAHGETLTDHEVHLGRFNEWKDGYNAAARVTGQPQVH